MSRCPYPHEAGKAFTEGLRKSSGGFYLSNDRGLDLVSEQTGLSPEEIVEIVGVFHKGHRLAGLPKGELVKGLDGSVIIRHHFTKKTLWRSD